MKLIKKIILSFVILFFIGCGENTDTPLTHLVTSIDINVTSVEMYSTDDIVKLGATVTFDDGTTTDVTDSVYWYNSDYNSTSMLGGEISGGQGNGGESNVSIEYENFSDFVTVKVHKLDFNSTYISSADINTTGIHPLEVKGSFDNNDTNITIIKNLRWDTNNGAIITVENNLATIEIINTGETNVSVRFFDDNSSDLNISYTVQ